MQRQLRYYVKSTPEPTIHHWNILIINQNREIERITQLLFEELKPVDNFSVRTEGVAGEGLRYCLITLDSYGKSPENIELKKIYKGLIKKDRNLQERQSHDGLANYVDEAVKKGIFS